VFVPAVFYLSAALIVSSADDQSIPSMGAMSRESEPEPRNELTNRLGYLLKHAQQRLYELNAAALEPFGITGRELAVLVVLDALGPTSQHDAARGLGVDRTTMVGLIDGLEAKGLVVRRPFEEDRRRNVVEFTERGRDVYAKAAAASDSAEREFLSGLSESEGARLKAVLRSLV
jgi:DNA-binding MarR family transcriptional regulator